MLKKALNLDIPGIKLTRPTTYRYSKDKVLKLASPDRTEDVRELEETEEPDWSITVDG